MIPLLLGTALGPILAKAGIGASLGLGATALGGGVAGITSLLQGNTLLQAALDAFGGGSGAGALGNLAKSGQAAVASGAASAGQSAGTAAAQGLIDDAARAGQGLMQINPSTLAAEYQAAAAPASAGFLAANPSAGFMDALGAGAKDLLSPGGASRFATATGESALSSVGVPAAGLAMSALTPPTAMPAGEMSFDLGPFTPFAEVRRRNLEMGYAEGGIAALNPMHGMFDARNGMPEYGEPKNEYKKGGYLDGPGDGMSDDIPATIEGKQPARLADGEFVVPADVVSHLGNGSTKAGAKRLYAMMAKVRKARTGNEKQGREINPNKYMPA